MLQSETRQTDELTLKSATGGVLTVRLEGIAAEDPITHKTNCRLSLSDITERKEAERRRDLTSALAALFAQKAYSQRVSPVGGGTHPAVERLPGIGHPAGE